MRAMEQIALMEVLVYGLKDELGRAYKETDMIRQRLNSFENEFTSAKSCVGNLVGKMTYSESYQLILEEDVDRAQRKATELEIRIRQLEQENIRLERERDMQSRKTAEVIAKSTSDESSWKRALELASTQASERAERALADCEWKMRELERRARDSDKKVAELTNSLENSESVNVAQTTQLSQLQVASEEQQRSIAALANRCVAAESREMVLKQELEENKECLENTRGRNAGLEDNVKELDLLRAKLTCEEKQQEVPPTESRSKAECGMLKQRHLLEIKEQDQEIDPQEQKYKMELENAEQASEQLKRKYACLQKLFEDIKTSQQADQREIAVLRSEVARLTNVILHNGIAASNPETKICLDGCDRSQLQQTSAGIFPEQTASRTSNNVASVLDSTKIDTKSMRKHTRSSPKKVLASKMCYARPFRKHKMTFISGRSQIKTLRAVQVPMRIGQLEGNNVE